MQHKHTHTDTKFSNSLVVFGIVHNRRVPHLQAPTVRRGAGAAGQRGVGRQLGAARHQDRETPPRGAESACRHGPVCLWKGVGGCEVSGDGCGCESVRRCIGEAWEARKRKKGKGKGEIEIKPIKREGQRVSVFGRAVSLSKITCGIGA